LSGITGRKGRVGGRLKRGVKVRGSTPDRPCGLSGSSTVEAGGIPGVAVECVEIRKNTGGEGGLLGSDASLELTLRRDSVGSKQD
jgi:hypothetical protein